MRFPFRRCATLPIVCLTLFTVLVAPSRSMAWSYKEHIMFARLAVLRLMNDPTTPPAMKDWLTGAAGTIPDMAAEQDYFMHTHVGAKPDAAQYTGISYWVYQPDDHAQSDPQDMRIAPFGVHERMLHFIDLELLLPGDTKKEYKHDLSGKPRLGDIPRDMTDPRFIQAGMLPFRVDYCYNQLVQSIRNGRLSAPSVEEQDGKTAIYWAGYLSHYLADNTQPQHSTIDYKSATYFADKRKAPNVHGQVEYAMCDDQANDYQALRAEYWPLFVKYIDEFQDPVQTKDLWQATLEVCLKSYDALPMIGLAAMHAAKQGGTPEHPTGEASPTFNTEDFFHFHGQYMGREMSMTEMKAIQTAWAVKRIEKVLRQAWDEASVTATTAPKN